MRVGGVGRLERRGDCTGDYADGPEFWVSAGEVLRSNAVATELLGVGEEVCGDREGTTSGRGW